MDFYMIILEMQSFYKMPNCQTFVLTRIIRANSPRKCAPGRAG